jgi:integrase
MPEPGINELPPQKRTKFDKIRIMSNSPTAPEEVEPKKKKRGRGGAPVFLTAPEMERLLAIIPNVRDRAAFSIAYHRGLRASEIGMLELRDYTPAAINERVGKLYCRRLKDSYSKIYDLTRQEDKDLRAWLRLRGKHPGPLFDSSHRRGIGRSMLHLLMRKYCALAGIKLDLAHFHTLKHTCAVHLLQQGLGLDQVQSWLGHRDIHSTMVYLRVVDIRLKEASDKLVNWR